MCVLRSEQPGHLNVRAVLRHCVPNKGLRSLAPLCGYPCRPSVNAGGHFYPNLSGGHTHCQCKNHYPSWKPNEPLVNGSLFSSNTRHSSTKTALPTVRKANGKSANISLLKQMTELSPLAIPDQAAIGGNMGKSLRTKGALLYGYSPYVRPAERTSQTPECLGRFASLRSEQGAAPLAPLCGYPCRPSVNSGGLFLSKSFRRSFKNVKTEIPIPTGS